jgi:hypothetical protein
MIFRSTFIIPDRLLLVWAMVSFKDTISQCNFVDRLYKSSVINHRFTDPIPGCDTSIVRFWLHPVEFHMLTEPVSLVFLGPSAWILLVLALAANVRTADIKSGSLSSPVGAFKWRTSLLGTHIQSFTGVSLCTWQGPSMASSHWNTSADSLFVLNYLLAFVIMVLCQCPSFTFPSIQLSLLIASLQVSSHCAYGTYSIGAESSDGLRPLFSLVPW